MTKFERAVPLCLCNNWQFKAETTTPHVYLTFFFSRFARFGLRNILREEDKNRLFPKLFSSTGIVSEKMYQLYNQDLICLEREQILPTPKSVFG